MMISYLAASIEYISYLEAATTVPLRPLALNQDSDGAMVNPKHGISIERHRFDL